MSTPEQWFRSLGVVTKYYFLGSVATTILVSFGALNPMYLVLDFDLVFKKFQIWRLFANFFFFGKFGMGFLFQIYLLTKYFQLLESGYYSSPRGTAEFLTMISFGITSLTLIAWLWGDLYFLGPALIFMVLYVYSRKSPFDQVSFFGFLFQTWHLPFVMVVFAILLGSNPILDVIGILVGHLWHFLVDIIPQEYQVNPIKTPEFLYNLLEGRQAFGRPNWQNAGGYRIDG